MAIPTDNREFYKILNDDDLLSQFVCDQNLAQKSEEHTCYCGSPMVDGTRKKTLKDGTVKIYPTMRCTNRQCRNQVCQEKLNDAPQMGDIGEVVQIDESLFRGK
ncbi:unnamed protein product, partial [Didymodactylos carnosus]